MARTIVIPYTPRPLQAKLHSELKRFNVIVCHRRFGKTVFAINHLIKSAFTCQLKNPRFYYVAPYYGQSKRIAWDFVKQYTRVIPGTTYNESELRCDFPNGARIQLLGADNADSLRGVYADGIILDEVAQMSPRLYAEVLGPTLIDRKGYVVFMGTPQGMANELYTKWVIAQTDPEWYSAVFPASETGIIPEEELERAKKQMSDEQYAAEYLCSFATSLQGAYYADAIIRAREEGRVTQIDWVPSLPVFTYWDLGMADSTAIWFVQRSDNNQIRFIDYYENSGEGLGHYINVLSKRPYVYAIDSAHTAPHDIKVRELGTGKSRWEQAAGLGIRFQICPNLSLEDGIEAARLLLKTCWFDADKCKEGLKALENYRRQYNEDRQCFNAKPLHDWTSHAADSFRYTAIMIDRTTEKDAADWNRPLNWPSVGVV